MTPTQRSEMASRLISQQKILRDVCDACKEQAEINLELGFTGMAFAAQMVRESLLVYSKESNEVVKKLLKDPS